MEFICVGPRGGGLVESSLRAERKNLLSRTAVFRTLAAPDLDALLSISRSKRFGPNQLIFDRGDPGDALYVVLHGRVGIRTLSASGKEIFLNILEREEVFGEIAVLDGRVRTAGAVAMEPTELLVINRNRFIKFLETRPRLCIDLIVLLCDRIRWTSDIIEDAIFLDLRCRLAKRILRLASSYGTDTSGGVRVGIRISQDNLGRMLGVTRESINKEFGALQTLGAIRYQNGYITIMDAGILEQLANST